ncbi:MAG TPA: MFS transporter, partial [Nevskiaceae bacterium]|nr:MFS transporter [Nevskiaceae bacterium]
MSIPAIEFELPAAEADAARAKYRRNWLGFMAMTVAVFMAFLDIQVVASSLNQIQAGLSATAQEISWVQSAYIIAEVIAIPLSGYLSRILSTRVYFTLSVLGFTLASAACAMAWNIESMMLFRAIQGFLGGGMIPSSFAALYIMFPPDKRIVPQVLAGLVATSAPTLGPVLGGW